MVLFGIVVLAFPMTIIISKFQDSFTVKKLNANKEMTRKLREMAICSYPSTRGKSNRSGISQVENGKAHVPNPGKCPSVKEECDNKIEHKVPNISRMLPDSGAPRMPGQAADQQLPLVLDNQTEAPHPLPKYEEIVGTTV